MNKFKQVTCLYTNETGLIIDTKLERVLIKRRPTVERWYRIYFRYIDKSIWMSSKEVKL